MRRALALLLLAAAPILAADDDGWIDLTRGGKDFDAWKSPTEAWATAKDVRPSPGDGRKLSFDPGEGIIVNGPTGKTRNLVSKQNFGDVEVHLEFLVPKGSNSGIKLEGLYEIQIADSYGKATATASDCGGIYPRAELLPNYHHIDKGYPPRTNACKAPGDWQTLDITFHAPRFDADGKKTANARFDKVVLNGQVVQEGVDLDSPTGHAWHNKEVAAGPILLQADHGPIAFRNVRVRPIERSTQEPK